MHLSISFIRLHLNVLCSCVAVAVVTSQAKSSAKLLEGLNRGLLKLGIGKVSGSTLSSHIRKMELKETDDRSSESCSFAGEEGNKEGNKDGCCSGERTVKTVSSVTVGDSKHLLHF